jgi:hypothetical protein
MVIHPESQLFTMAKGGVVHFPVGLGINRTNCQYHYGEKKIPGYISPFIHQSCFLQSLQKVFQNGELPFV